MLEADPQRQPRLLQKIGGQARRVGGRATGLGGLGTCA